MKQIELLRFDRMNYTRAITCNLIILRHSIDYFTQNFSIEGSP